MTNPIVSVNVHTRVAPTPSKLQKSGAMISQGATNTSVGTFTLLTQKADLTPIINGSLSITGITQSAGTATAVTAAAHGLPLNDPILATVAGASPSAYNGTFLVTPTTTTHFTYAVPSGTTSPATGTIVYTLEDVAELTAMANTFFAQGSQQAVWVLELGPDSVTAGVATFAAWITANPNVFYSYLIPRSWDANSAFLTFLAGFEAQTSKTYFFVTTTLATYQNYTSLMKDAFALIEAPAYGKWSANVLTALSQTSGNGTATTTSAHGVSPGQYFTLSGNLPAAWNATYLALTGTTGSTLLFNVSSSIGAETQLGTLVASQYSSTGVPATEFSCAAPFQVTLNYAPSSTNRVTPLNLAFVFGVTPFPSQGNAALLATLDTANINIISTGAQGGISDAILFGGNMMDGNPFNYWYSIDWAQITGQQAVTAECINGSNDPENPLYYNQPGINRLQQVLSTTMANGISYGLVLNPVKPTTLSATDFATALDAGDFDGFTAVNAEPFPIYTSENPNDYAAGTYNGLSVAYVPQRGFESIVINITASSFA